MPAVFYRYLEFLVHCLYNTCPFYVVYRAECSPFFGHGIIDFSELFEQFGTFFCDLDATNWLLGSKLGPAGNIEAPPVAKA